MPVVNIAPATRQGMKYLISLYGMSETGKTKSALRLMAGMEPDPAKRGLLDTEGGERGRAYYDEIEGGFMYGALTPPFTPERYVEALMDFVAAGVTTLTVDSASHAWFAEGGILDMVESANEKNDMAKWAKPKRRLGKLTQKWSSCGLHVILCSRGKQPLVEEIVDGRKKLIPGPVIPIQEKSLRYDMTIMAHMMGDGQFSVDRANGGKCPGALRPIFAAAPVMDEEMGRKLIAWIGGQDAMTPEQRKLKMVAEEEAEAGSVSFKAWWKDQLTATDRNFLKGIVDNLQSIAKAADKEAARQAAGNGELDEETKTAPFGKAAIAGGIESPNAQEAA